jgi:acetyltransferase-like isoleucine patch superfamily enzyme
MFFKNLSLKIRRRETPFYDRLYRLAKAFSAVEFPVIKPFHRFFYNERRFRLSLWRNVLRVVYYGPLFKSRCEQVGRRLRLIGGIPLVTGHLTLYIGDNVVIHGYSTFVGAKVVDEPKLIVGNNAHLGYNLTITVGEEVFIGNDVLIANRVFIAGYDGHPVDAVKRRGGLPAAVEEGKKSIRIEDNVWVGDGATILKGVTIGKGSVVGAGSVVTKDVPPYTIVAGNPAKAVKVLKA